MKGKERELTLDLRVGLKLGREKELSCDEETNKMKF